MRLSLSILCALAARATCSQGQSWKRDNATCKCYPGDDCWPSPARWDALNSATRGRVSAFVPAGAVCYPSFNNASTASVAKCDAVKANWTNANWM